MTIEINISITDSTYNKMNEIVEIENRISKLVKNNWKERSVDDFIKSAIIEAIERFDNYDEYLSLLSNDGHSFQNNFKQIANKLDISQSHISHVTGINTATLSQIFNNKQQPRMDLFMKIWICLGCPPLYKCLSKKKD